MYYHDTHDNDKHGDTHHTHGDTHDIVLIIHVPVSYACQPIEWNIMKEREQRKKREKKRN